MPIHTLHKGIQSIKTNASNHDWAPTGTHHSNPESATPVLSLRNGAFTDQLILSIILEYFSGENGSTTSCTHPLFDIVTVKKKERKEMAIKTSVILFSGLHLSLHDL